MAREKHPALALLEKACKEHKIGVDYCDCKEEWIHARRGCLTGTDMAALLGLSPWKTAGEVILDKRGRLSAIVESEAMEWGLRHEDTILKAYEEKNPNIKVYKPKPWTLFLQAGKDEEELLDTDGWGGDDEGGRPQSLGPAQQKDYSLLAGTPDAFAVMEGVGLYGVEVKTAGTSEGWKAVQPDKPGELTFINGDDIPIQYYVQVQTYMAIMPFIQFFDVVVLIAGNKFRVYHVKRDEDMIETIKNYGYQIYCQYLQSCRTDVEIPGAMLEKNPDACVKAWPSSQNGVGLSLESSDRASIAAEAYFYVNKYISFLETLKTNLRGIIVARMKTAEALTAGDVKVSYKSGGSAIVKIDHEKQINLTMEFLRRDFPTVVQPLLSYLHARQGYYYTTVSPGTRRFLVTVPKDKQKTISAEVINGQLQKLGESHMGHAVPAIGVDEAEV